MSTRMNVAVGYGLDITGMNRDNLDYDLLAEPARYDAFMDEALTYAIEHDDLSERMRLHPKALENLGIKDLSLDDMVIHQEEFGDPNKLLLFPHGFKKNWHRAGNILDAFAYEASKPFTDNDWMEPEWREKPGTLYPFIGLMRADASKPLGYEEYWESCYLADEEHKDAIPVAPAHLWFLIKHLGLVPEDQVTDTFLKLRPTLYRWWC